MTLGFVTPIMSMFVMSSELGGMAGNFALSAREKQCKEADFIFAVLGSIPECYIQWGMPTPRCLLIVTFA